MRRRPSAALALLLPVFLSGGWALAFPAPSPVLASPAAPPISGIVSHLEKPIAGALVILYNLGDTSLARSRTAPDGTFVLASAPVGVYDLVAYKKGFFPALVRVWHQPLPEGVSSLHIRLAARNEGGSTLLNPCHCAHGILHALPVFRMERRQVLGLQRVAHLGGFQVEGAPVLQ